MNWGYKLLMTYGVFMAGMGYLVYRSMNTNYELVEKDYYKSELKYQQVIDGSKLAGGLTAAVQTQQSDSTIDLVFPPEMRDSIVTGNVWFYCAYDAKRDQHLTLESVKAGRQSYSLRSFAPGQYTVKIEWNSGHQDFYTEDLLTISR